MTASCSSSAAAPKRWSSTTAGCATPATTPPKASACARSPARSPAMPMPPRSPRPRSRRAADTARLAVGAGGGTLAAAAGADQPAALWRCRSDRRMPRLRSRSRRCARSTPMPAPPIPRVVQVSATHCGVVAGGGDPAPRRQRLSPISARWRGSTSRSSSRRTAGANGGSHGGGGRAGLAAAARTRLLAGRGRREALRIAAGQPACRAGAGRGDGCRARPGLARHPSARGDRPRAGGRFQPQEDLGLRRTSGQPDRGAGRDGAR